MEHNGITLQTSAAPANGSEQRYARQNLQPPVMTLRTYALAAVAALAYDPSKPCPDGGEAQFLFSHLAAVTKDSASWASTLPAYLRQPDTSDASLFSLSLELGLHIVELLVVALATAVEDDAVSGRAIAYLQAPIGGSRPTLGLLTAAFAPVVETERSALDILLTGAAFQSGLLTLSGEGAPLPEQAVKVPLALCLALRGRDSIWPGTTFGLGDVPEVALPPSLHSVAQRYAEGLRSSSQLVLVLRSSSIAEGRSVARAIAETLQCRPLFIETEKTGSLVPWLFLRRLLPVFCFELAPGERKTVPSLPSYRGPVLVLCGPDGSVETLGGVAPSWSLPVPSEEEREQLWRYALDDAELAADLARHHRHGSGRIALLGRLARYQCSLKGRERPTKNDVVAASWNGEGAGLDALAQPLKEVIPDDALVVTPALRRELDILVLRCRTRDRLVHGLGVSAQARYHPGVRALFVGPSGTGKTLAAGWLATKLGLPLYRVDLASVTSKYIGETEKNLAQLLARAEQAEVILLFDEADSLFGKRTDVKEANDRFANAQTNYLLQRLETFDGVTLLTSNSRTRFDAAFTRRLDMIIEFPLPGPEERRALWGAHLGTTHQFSPKELNQLATVADIGGGHIRNAVLTAAVLAQEKRQLIDFADVIHGLNGEYKKLGRQLPIEFIRLIRDAG